MIWVIMYFYKWKLKEFVSLILFRLRIIFNIVSLWWRMERDEKDIK